MKRIALLDIGSNSVKLLVAEWRDERWQGLQNFRRTPRLGSGVAKTGLLSVAAIERTLSAITELLADARASYTFDTIHAVGTEALRRGANRDVFLQQLQQQFGFTVQVLSGEEEARYAFQSAVSDLPLSTELVTTIDIGGGSTDIAWGLGRQFESSLSVPLGAVSLSENFLPEHPIPEAHRHALEAYIEDELDLLLDRNPQPEVLIGVGGTATNLLRLKLATPKLADTTGILSAVEVRKLYAELSAMSILERKRMTGIDPDRADILPAGIAILLRLISYWQCETVTISTRGLRHGILQQLKP